MIAPASIKFSAIRLRTFCLMENRLSHNQSHVKK